MDSAPDSGGPPTPAELADIINDEDGSVAMGGGKSSASGYPSRRSSLSDTLYIDMTTLSLTSTLVFGDSRRGSLFHPETKDKADTEHNQPEGAYDTKTSRAYIAGAVARAPASMLALNFIGPVLIRYAIMAVGREGRVFGLVKASSVVTLCYTLFSFTVILLGPIVGTLADFTNWRKKIMIVLLFLINALTALLIITGTDTWQATLFILWLLISTGELTGIPINSYLPEVSSDQQRLTVLNANALVFFKVVAMVFAGVSIAVGAVFHLEDAERIQAACLVALCISVPASIYTACCMPFREAVCKWEGPGPRHPFVAFQILFRNMCSIRVNYPMVFRYLASRACSKAAGRSVGALATTYFISELNISAANVTILLTVAFVTGIMGALLSILVGKRHRGTKTPLVVGQILMGISIAICPVVLSGPAVSIGLPMLFSAFWGVVLGFNAAWDEPYFTLLIPGGREAEMFGLHIFSGTLFEWLPPVLFSVCDTKLPSGQKLGLQLLSVFYFTGAAILFTVDTSKGKAQSSGTLHLRRIFGGAGAAAPATLPDEERPHVTEDDIKQITRIFHANKHLSVIPESPAGMSVNSTAASVV